MYKSNFNSLRFYLLWQWNEPSKAQWSLYVPPGLTFSNSTFYPHAVFMRFAWISEQAAIISLHSINWLVFITETDCVYCAVRNGSLYIKPFKAQWLLYVPPCLTFSNSTFCPHSTFMRFAWIWEQTAIISLYRINWLVFITETDCVYCAVRNGSLTIIQIIVCSRNSGEFRAQDTGQFHI
jgi:hypothetical protein